MLINLIDDLESIEISFVNISVNDSSLLDANQIMEFTFAKLNLISQLLEKECLSNLSKGLTSATAPCSQEFSISCRRAMNPLWLIQYMMTQ